MKPMYKAIMISAVPYIVTVIVMSIFVVKNDRTRQHTLQELSIKIKELERTCAEKDRH